MIPRLLAASPDALLDADGYLDLAEVLACALADEKPGGHGDRAAAAEHARAFGAQMPDAKPSALLDHEARRVSEIDVINGAVRRVGARVGVAAPVNATLTTLIKTIERQWA